MFSKEKRDWILFKNYKLIVLLRKLGIGEVQLNVKNNCWFNIKIIIFFRFLDNF